MTDKAQLNEYIAIETANILGYITALDPQMLADINGGKTHILALHDENDVEYNRVGLRSNGIDFLIVEPYVRKQLNEYNQTGTSEEKGEIIQDVITIVEHHVELADVGYVKNTSNFSVLFEPMQEGDEGVALIVTDFNIDWTNLDMKDLIATLFKMTTMQCAIENFLFHNFGDITNVDV